MADTPNVRFKGFTGAWEQRKLLDEVTSVDTGKSKFVSHKLGKYEILGSTSVIGYDDSYDYEGDFLLTARVGANAGELYRHSGKVKISDNTVFIQGKQLDFIYYALFNFDIKKLSFGTGQPLVKASELKEQKISMPISYNEREQIGIFFSRLDDLITLHQRKCEETKELKKYMLQKMFPQNGKKIPEIRFAGFTNDWEQRKLGEITERVTRKNQDLESELPLTISAQYGLIDQNEFFDKRVASKDVSGYYLVQHGEFAYNKSTSSDAPWGAVKRLDRYEKGVLSTLYIVFRIIDESKTASDYIVTYYDTDLWYKGVQAIAAEGARNHGLLNITPSDFFETTLMIPKDIDEQNRIGRYFKTLDHLITLHQCKCDELTEVKKFMLQNMFPQKG
ncbi:MAG: restriction endonuclease subunit S [Treponema sp.]|nr:restriction endonuclease subunit S [Treponema sp.]